MLLAWLRKPYRQYKIRRLMRELIIEVDELETKVRKHHV